MRTLVLCSGGLDSTTALVKLLKETDDEIHCHHIFYYTNEGRGEAEKEAIEKIIPYCQKIRPFKYTTSIQDYTQIDLPYDIHVCRFLAAQICRHGGIDRVVSGKCKDDTNPLDVANAIFSACLCGNPDGVKWYYPVEDMTKYDEKAYLQKEAPELLDFIHCCRKPIKVNGKWTSCNKCHTCHQSLDTEWQYIFSNPLN
jgi:7-cyano-7-deazaguanine synthase in queuosine biosynthesis